MTAPNAGASPRGLAIRVPQADDGRPDPGPGLCGDDVAKLYIDEKGKTSVYEILEDEVTIGR